MVVHLKAFYALNISHDGYEKTRVQNIWNLENSPQGNSDVIQTWKIYTSRWSQTAQTCKFVFSLIEFV